jgi:putative ABC transport system substrate-binding protein
VDGVKLLLALAIRRLATLVRRRHLETELRPSALAGLSPVGGAQFPVQLSRVAVLGASTSQSSSPVIREIELAAKAFGVKLQKLDVLDSKDIELAFRAATKGRADVVLTVPNAILAPQRTQITEFAVKNRLPAMYHNSQFIDAGGLMYYGVNLLDSDRRAAIFVDKILKGRKPADLPVEQPLKFEFIVNLKAAKAIGLTVPPNVLVRADRVIK